MQNNIFITNKEKLEKTKEHMRQDGAPKLHVLADFDRTLTTAFVDGVSVPSLISVLRDGNYLTLDYAEKAHDLFDTYHPIEMDPYISREEKSKAMEAWWRDHFKLLIASGLKKNDLKEVATSGKVKFREGFVECVDLLHKHGIPLVIMSSSGLGSESIALYFKQAGTLYDNVHIIGNEYQWDEKGKAVGVREPIIHMLNKYETMIKDYPAFDAVRERKNVILLGDSVDDVGMVEGFEYDNLITVGFLNDKIEENLANYQNTFDVVLTEDTSMFFVNELLKDIIK